MNNFTFQNPVKIIFGKGSIAELPNNLYKGEKIMMTYGGGSIKKNGVYDQVKKALEGYSIIEFEGCKNLPRRGRRISSCCGRRLGYRRHKTYCCRC